MQRILNNPDNIVDEMLAGFVKCHSDIVKHVVTSEDNPRGVVAAADAPRAGKVGIVTAALRGDATQPPGALEEARAREDGPRAREDDVRADARRFERGRAPGEAGAHHEHIA